MRDPPDVASIGGPFDRSRHEEENMDEITGAELRDEDMVTEIPGISASTETAVRR